MRIRAFLTLKYIEGLSDEEIAELTDIGVSATKMTIARAKKELTKYSLGTNSRKLEAKVSTHIRKEMI